MDDTGTGEEPSNNLPRVYVQVLTGAALLVAGILGYFVLWRGQIAPYFDNHTVLHLKADFASFLNRSEVVEFVDQDRPDEILALSKSTVKERVKNNGISALLDTFERDISRLRPASLESDGKTDVGAFKGEIKIEKGKVWYDLYPLGSTATSRNTLRFVVIECNPAESTASLRSSTADEKLYILKGVSTAEWTSELNDHRVKHDDLMNRDRLRREQDVALAKQKELDERARQEALKQKQKEEEAQSFASATRASFPLGQTIQLSVKLDAVASGNIIRETNGGTIYVQRIDDGTSSGGARYVVKDSFGTVELADSLAPGSLTSAHDAYVLKSNDAGNRAQGWSDLVINPKFNEISGVYKYIVDSIGFSCAYIQEYNFPIVDQITFGSQAYHSELKSRDMIMSINGVSTSGSHDLLRVERMMANARPTIDLQIKRDTSAFQGTFGYDFKDKHIIIERQAKAETVHVRTTYLSSRSSDSLIVQRASPVSTPSPTQISIPQSRIPEESDSGADTAKAEQVIRQYFAARQSSDSRTAAQCFDARDIYYYGSEAKKGTVASLKIRREIESRIADQDRQNPFRNFRMIGRIKVEPRNGHFDAVAHVGVQLATSRKAASPEAETLYFIRLRATTGGVYITHMDGVELPGWQLANYRAWIGSHDIQRTDGTPFSSVPFESKQVEVREIIFQNRVNYQHGDFDSRSEDNELFHVEKLPTLLDKLRGLRVEVEGNPDRIIAGGVLVNVEIRKDEVIKIRLLR